MRLDTLKHLARAILGTSEAERVIVFGSASLLPSFPELGDDHGGPLKNTFDADFIPTPFEEEMGQLLNLTFGKSRPFHNHFGYYADIIRPFALEEFAKGWEDRVVPLPGVERVFCLEHHDMAAASARQDGQRMSSCWPFSSRQGRSIRPRSRSASTWYPCARR